MRAIKGVENERVVWYSYICTNYYAISFMCINIGQFTMYDKIELQ